MTFKLVVEADLTGKKTQIFSVLFQNGEDWEKETSYDKFFLEYEQEYWDEISDIDYRIHTIGNVTGLRQDHFKPDEGTGGDGVVAFFDIPEKKLRLYGICYGSVAIILGGGGPKPKSIRAFQECPKLTMENAIMRKVSAIITQAIRDRRIMITENGLETIDDFVFEDE